MSEPLISPLHPQPAAQPGDRIRWGQLHGSAQGLSIAQAARQQHALLLVVTDNTASAQRLKYELRFYLGQDSELPVMLFPSWETLPYDVFSPHQSIISERLASLHRLPSIDRGVLIAPITTLMHRLPPRSWLEGQSLALEVGARMDLEQMRHQLVLSGYRNVSQVMEHGEFAVRGALLDLFPMGSPLPYRIELFDDEIETLRSFDPETQRSLDQVDAIRLLPAHEFPLDEAGIRRFRSAWRERFAGDPQRSPIYRSVSQGLAPGGIEYYLPLFFEHTDTLFDYLPESTLIFSIEGSEAAAEGFWGECKNRYEQLAHDIERPLLPPAQLFLRGDEVLGALAAKPRTQLQTFALPEQRAAQHNFASAPPPNLFLDARTERPLAALQNFLDGFAGRVLFAVESAGRREALLDLLHGSRIQPEVVAGWSEFINGSAALNLTVAPLDHGLLLSDPAIAVITEPQLYGEQVMQRRRRKTRSHWDADAVIRNLTELQSGAPVVHEEHGIGRYLGLQTLDVGGLAQEFLTLEYAGGDKLYVPVASLHLISRYTGAAPESAPLHKLGSGQWEKARRKASEKVRDVAAELLAIYAQRAARQGHRYQTDAAAYQAFAAGFPFEATPDQQEAIDAVLADMAGAQPMDRLICGDVGFGKTEVAMRAAFVAAMDGKQVAMLVPTTLLAQQHHESFRDRFANWPVRIESISRFRSRKEQEQVLEDLRRGTIDIIIGTHKLLQENIKLERLGLLIIDEEHRFGVRQKDRFKALRAEVDILTLTATPIPRTLNMSLAHIRDLSIIATPPARRLAVKTFISEWQKPLIQEACLRELKRGGQVYFLHNDVKTIEKMADEIAALVPEARVRHAHGQMPERELERVMSDFYHQRFNLLVCTTIIETGIDIPTANTIIINRADRLGLAQLYQLRGRVGRSHHRAYAYLIVPPRRQMTDDALKRLEAIAAIEELGTGFTLATHDLEIRGAGELLGEEQSGQMQEIGFTLYSELLERAIAALKEGREPELDRPLDHGTEVDLHIPALIPEDYLPDVHSRLILYKRIASAPDHDALRDLQVEMIDRFGLLPEAAKNLIRITEIKLQATPLGIRKIELGPAGGRLTFSPQPNVDGLKIIELIQGKPKVFQLDGQERLRISKELPDAASRLTLLENLLGQIA